MMAGLDRVCLEDLADYFEGLDDPRSAVSVGERGGDCFDGSFGGGGWADGDCRVGS